MAAQQTNMEEILTSIRTTLAEETAKAGTPAATAVAEEMSDEEVLALSEADVMPAANAEETVDLAAFGQEGEVKMQPAANVSANADVLGEGPETPVAATAAPAAPVEAAAAPAATPAPAKQADDLDKLIAEIASEPAPAAAPTVPAASAGVANAPVSLGLVGDVADLQVALPAEVLAAALRPLVQTWLEQNLAGVVERLVQAEISKLSNAE
ncbi:MAG TPA: DUF2497 domain-containing protein [Alphaproteobacteria bacterium]|nr:DUF2497 domain-containing protein [Alphaproteobacteria bacterium]